MNMLIITHDLIDTWREKNPSLQGFTWSNPSMKIQCGLDYFIISKDMRLSLKYVKLIPNILSDHSALSLTFISEEKEAACGPGFWKLNNSLLTHKGYTELISKKLPEFASKYCEVTDKGLLWKMIKAEIRATTILFSKKKLSKSAMKRKSY